MSKFTESLTVQTHAPKFHNPKLKAAAAELLEVSDALKAAAAEADKQVDTAQRRVAIILAGLPVDKSGRKLDVSETEGVKSIPEFMDKIFPGFSPATAYSLNKWGREVLTNDAARPELKAMPYSNFAEVASMKPKELEAAIDSGDIKADMTQSALREARKRLTDKGAAIIKMFDIHYVCGFDVHETFATVELSAVPEAIKNSYPDPDCVKVARVDKFEMRPNDAPNTPVPCYRYVAVNTAGGAIVSDVYDAIREYTPAKTPAQLEAEASDAALIARTMSVKGMTEAEAREFLVNAGLLNA